MAENDTKYEEEKTSANTLRNTPSNIRRLADEIQQCEGRQKYLARTRSPSDGGDIRWFFRKVPMEKNEVAAVVPRAEIVEKSDYFRFGMRDSLAIEASFLQQEEELLSIWWKEYAECSEGPKGSPASTKSDPLLKPFPLETNQSGKAYSDEEERVGVPVKGGLYEVDLVRRHCFPVYWDGDNRRVLRGHWFARKGGIDWLPLREDVSEQLEFAYCGRVWRRRTFQPSGLFAARVDMQGSSPGLHALFTGEDDTWEAWLSVDASGFSSIVKFGGTGIKLRRGYAPAHSPKPTQDELRQQKEEDIDDYCSEVPVRHLVFMVHGIGQRLEKANLVDDVGTFRHITASLAEQHLTSYQHRTQRVLFIPCQWRKNLKLSGESAVEKCTLPGVRGLRVMLSATVHDVLYYMSPIYCQDIIDSVSNQLNKLYLKFLKRNPGYDGKVSLYGHSLGSVLSYDILCHQETLTSPFPMEWMYKDQINYETSTPNDMMSSSLCNVSSNSFGTDFNAIVGRDMVASARKNIPRVQSESSLPGLRAAQSNSMLTPLVSAMDENPSATMDSKKHDSFIFDRVGIRFDQGSSEVLSEKDSRLDDCTGMDSEVLANGSNQIDEEVCQHDETTTIKSLREEKVWLFCANLEKFGHFVMIDFLNARIKELESHKAEGDKHEVRTTKNASGSKGSSSCKHDTLKRYRPLIEYTKLEFKVDTFFAVGSPLGVFLALRNVRMGIGKGKDYWDDENINEEMPSCRQMFNIFHPFDPVAYRVEPLVCKDLRNTRPVIIPYHRGGKRLHIGLQEFVEDVASSSQVVMDRMSSVKGKVLALCQSKDGVGIEASAETSEKPAIVERSYGSIMLEKLTGSEDGRIDHVLQDKTFQHQYISAVGAHTNYWRDMDTALFILKHLYQDIPEEPEIPDELMENETNQPTQDFQGWYDNEEAVEEDLPLTFSNSRFVKKFSRRAKSFIGRG
ncbi:phospholipase SGR2-like [Cynara cardunculus var. scolymus]|uniref:phospholipase SGR2-like n=1 Tax=Cynara cardunculus var. scolymus TaxID=59895 RepID=UPI000D62D17C|nr:phospholipase SGR2-like [Cynara cardunculus var. scolymus]